MSRKCGVDKSSHQVEWCNGHSIICWFMVNRMALIHEEIVNQDILIEHSLLSSAKWWQANG